MKNYSFIQKFLHDLVLSRKFINRSLYELEKIFYLKNKHINNQAHIFITGLPRSGTTSLLNFLYSSNQYASLTYRSMPFILSPNFSKIFNKKNISKKERIHGDGLTYDIDSPEAFDEVFFSSNEEFIKYELENYLQLILLSSNKEKYLSKNNLNYKRINLINSILPNSIFLIPIREPLQHANSLLKQHIHFSQLQKNDNFIKRYMNYLGHNEFGLGHKPWNDSINFHNFNKIDYWLEQWFLFYRNIFDKYISYKNCHFVIYEKLIDKDYVSSLLKKINFTEKQNLNLNYFKNSNKKNIDVNFSKSIFKNANDTYNLFMG